MYPIDYRERVKRAQERSEGVNCVSLVLYLLGLSEERYISPRRTDILQSYFELIDVDRPNTSQKMPADTTVLGRWIGTEYIHLAVVDPIYRSSVIHRLGKDAHISVREIGAMRRDSIGSGAPQLHFLKVRPEWYL